MQAKDMSFPIDLLILSLAKLLSYIFYTVTNTGTYFSYIRCIFGSCSGLLVALMFKSNHKAPSNKYCHNFSEAEIKEQLISPDMFGVWFITRIRFGMKFEC